MVSEKKIGILGGGQLGKMLCEAGSPWHLDLHILDKELSMPAAQYCSSFTEGNFKNYEDVMAFGKGMDILTIEIEHVNIDALFDLQKAGVKVLPKPEALVQIIDKGLQKQFYQNHDIPTAPFHLYESKLEILEALYQGHIQLPFVQKTRKEGYDGRGVQVIHNQEELGNIVDIPSVIEEMVTIDREVAVISARNPKGQVETFEPVDMKFKPGANLLDVLVCPAGLCTEEHDTIIGIAEKIIKKLDIHGLLAIEFFIDKNGHIFVNEVAPRPHNSGHHTIENNTVSQFEQHLRAILDFPLVTPKTLWPTVMINVLGEAGFQGTPEIKGLNSLLSTSESYFHWYGKKTTKPYRKMGHLTFIGKDIETAMRKASEIRKEIRIIAKQ